MKIKTIILLCLIYQVLQTYGLVQLKNSLATSDSPLLMKILQLVDAATSNEHLLEVTLKLLRSLCVCMRETLKVKEENYLITNNSVEPNESHITDGKVLDLYRNIYNNTCINLRQELTNRSQRYIAEEESTFLNHTSCGKDENNKTHITTEETDKNLVEQTPLPSKLENILLKALIQTRHLHKYRIKKYNLLGEGGPNTNSALRHDLNVILTLHPDEEETEPSRRHDVTEEDLNKILFTDSAIGIDIIDKKHDQSHNNNDKLQKPEIVSDCNLQSLYIFLTESERKNLTQVYKYIRKRETIKMYIEVNTSQNHSDYLNMCCFNGTSTPQCMHDAPIPTNMSNEKHNKTNLLRHYRNTITRIKKLVKLYEIKLNDTKDLDIPNDPYEGENKNTSNIDPTTEDNTAKEDLTSYKENDANKLILNSNDTTQLAEVTKAIVLLNDFFSKQTTQHYLQTVEVNQTNIDKAYTEKPSNNTEFENLQPNDTDVYNQTMMDVSMGVNNDTDKYHTTSTNPPLYHKSNAAELTTYFKPNQTSNSEDFLESIGVTAPMILDTPENILVSNLEETTTIKDVNNSSTLEVFEAIDTLKQPVAVNIGENKVFANVLNNTVTPVTTHNEETISFMSPQTNDQNKEPSDVKLTEDILNSIISNNDTTTSYDVLSASTNMNIKRTINDVDNEETTFTETFNREVKPTITDYKATSVSTPSSTDLNPETYYYADDVIENTAFEDIVTITPELNSEDKTIDFAELSTVEDNVNSFNVDVIENTTIETSTITPEPANNSDIESKDSTDLIDVKSSVDFIDNVTTLANTFNNTMTTELGIDDKTVGFITGAALNSTELPTADVTDKTTELERGDQTMAASSPLTLMSTSESPIANVMENTTISDIFNVTLIHQREGYETMGSSILPTTDLKNAELSATYIIENNTDTFTTISELASDDETTNFTTQSPVNFIDIEALMDDAIDNTVVVNAFNTSTTTEFKSDAEAMTSTVSSTTDINIIKPSIFEDTDNTTLEDAFNFITASDDEIMDFALPLNTGPYLTPDSFVQNDYIFDKDLMLDRTNYTDDTDIESFTDISTLWVTPDYTQSVTNTSTSNLQATHANKTIANLTSNTVVTENIKANFNTNIDSSESVTSTPMFINITDDLKNKTNIQSTTLSAIASIRNIFTGEEQILSPTPNVSNTLISEATKISNSSNNEYSKIELNHEPLSLKEDEVTVATSQEITTIATSNNTKIDLNTTFDKETKETVSIDSKYEYQTMNTTYLNYVINTSEPSPFILGTIEDLITSHESVNADTENTDTKLNKTELKLITSDVVPATLEENQSTSHEEEINKTKDSLLVIPLTKTEDFNKNVIDLTVIGLNTTDNSAAENQITQTNTLNDSNDSEIDNQNVTTNYSGTAVTTEEFVANYTYFTLSPATYSGTATNNINNYTLSDVAEYTSLNIQVQVPSTKSLPEKGNTFEPSPQTLKIEMNYDLHSSEVKETVPTGVNTEDNTEILHDVQTSTILTGTVETSTIYPIQNLTTKIDIIQDIFNAEDVDKVQFSPNSTDVTTEGNFSTPKQSLEINSPLKITTGVPEITNKMAEDISLKNKTQITKYDSELSTIEKSPTKFTSDDSNEMLLVLPISKQKDEETNTTPKGNPTLSETSTIYPIQNFTTKTDIIQDIFNAEDVDKVQFSLNSTDVTTEGNFFTPKQSLEINSLHKITTGVPEIINQMAEDISLKNETHITKYDSELSTIENPSTKLTSDDSNEMLLVLPISKQKDEDTNTTPKGNPTLSEDYTTISTSLENHSNSASDFRDKVDEVENVNSTTEHAYNLSLLTPGEEIELTHISNTTNENTSPSNETEKVHNRISEDELSTTQETETKEIKLTNSDDNNSTDTVFISYDLTTKQISTVNLLNQPFTAIPTLSLSTQEVFNYIHTLNKVEPNEILTTFTSETTKSTNISDSERHDDYKTYSPSLVKKEDATNASEVISNSLKITNSVDIENSTDDLLNDNSTLDTAEGPITTTVETTKALNNLTTEDNLVSEIPVDSNEKEIILTTGPESLSTEISTTISPKEENLVIPIKITTLGKPVDTSSFLLQPLFEESMEKILEHISTGTDTPELTTIQSFETTQSAEDTSDLLLTTTEVTEIKDLDTKDLTTTSGLSDNDNFGTSNKTFEAGNEAITQTTEYVLMQIEPDTNTATYNNTLSTMTESETGANTSNETISYETTTGTTPTIKLLSSNVTEGTEYETTLPKIEILSVKETSKHLKTSKSKKALKHPVAFELNIRVGVEANQDGIKFTVLGKKETAHKLSGSRTHQQLFANHSGRITTPPIRSETIFKSEITLSKEKNQSKTSLNNQLKDIVWTNMHWNRKSNYDQQADLARISTILNKLTWNPLPTVNYNYTENMNNTSIIQNTNQPKENITSRTRRVNFTPAYKNSTTNNTSTAPSSNFTNVKHKSKMPGALTQTPAINNIKSMYMKHLKKIKESMAFNKDENITAADVLSKIYNEMKLHPMGEIEIQNRSRSNITNTNNITLYETEMTNLNIENDTISNAPKLKKKKKLNSKGRKVKAALKKLLKGKKLTKKQLRKLTRKILKKNFTKVLDKKIHGVKNKFNTTMSNGTGSTSNKTTLQAGNVTNTQAAVNVTSVYVNNEASNITSLYVNNISSNITSKISNVVGNITNPFQNDTRKSKEKILIKEYKQQMQMLNKTGSYFLSGTRRKLDNSSESNDTSKLNSSNINSTNQNTTNEEKYKFSESTEKLFETNTQPVNTEVVTTIPMITKYEEILRVDNNNEREFQNTVLSTNDFQEKMLTSILDDTKSTSFKSIMMSGGHIKNATETTAGILTIDIVDRYRIPIDKDDDLIYKPNGVNTNNSTLAYHDANLIKTEEVTSANTNNEFSKYTVPMPTGQSGASTILVTKKTEDLTKLPLHFELHTEIELYDNVHSKTYSPTTPHLLQSDKNENPNNEPRDEENPMSVITITTSTTETYLPTTVSAEDISRQYDIRTTLLETDLDEINTKTWNIANNIDNVTTLGSNFSNRNVINTTDMVNTEDYVHNTEKVITTPEVISTTTDNTLSDQDNKENSANLSKSLGTETKQNARRLNTDTEDCLKEVREITKKTEEIMLESESMNFKTIANLSSEEISTKTTTNDRNVLHGTDSPKESKEETEVTTTDESLTTPYTDTSFIQSNENNKETNNSSMKLTSEGSTPSLSKGIDAIISSIEEEIDHYKSATVTNSNSTPNDSTLNPPLVNLTNNLMKLKENITNEDTVNEHKTSVYANKELTTLSPHVQDVINEPNVAKDALRTTIAIDEDLFSSYTEVLSKNQTGYPPTTVNLHNKYFHDTFGLTEQPKYLTTQQVTSSEHNINLDQDQQETKNVNTSIRIVTDEHQETTTSMIKENITVQHEDLVDKHLHITNKKDLHDVIYKPQQVIYVPTAKSLLLYGHKYNYRATWSIQPAITEKPALLPKFYILDQDTRQTVLNRTNENKYSSVKSVTSTDINKFIENSQTDSNSSNMTTTSQYKEYVKLLDIDNANSHTISPYTHSKLKKRFQIKSNNNNLRPFEETNINTSSKLQYYNFKAHDSVENISLNQTAFTKEKVTDMKLYNSTGHSTNHYDPQHYPVPYEEIRFRSEQANLNDTVRNEYQNHNNGLNPNLHTMPTKSVKETRIQIYSSHLHRSQVTVTTSTPTTKSIKYNTYQPTTKEDLELLKYQDGVPVIRTPTLNPTNPANIQPQSPKLNNSCAILRNISDKFNSKDEFIKILKAANCTDPDRINLTDSYHQDHNAKENKNVRPPIEIIKIPQSSENDNHHPILEININSPQIGTSGDSPPMIEINGNPLPMEIHGHSIPRGVQGSSPQAINLATNLVPINQNIPYSNGPNINMEPMHTIQIPQPQNFYGNSPGLEMDRNSMPRLTDRNTMLVGMPETLQNRGNLQPMLNEKNMIPPSTLEINKNLQPHGLNRLTSPIISSDHKYFSDVIEQPYMSANVDNSAAISDNDRYYVPVDNNNFNSPVPRYKGGSPTIIEDNWSPTLDSNSNRNSVFMMNTNINPQLVIENNSNLPNKNYANLPPTVIDNDSSMMNLTKTSLPMAKDNVEKSEIFINSNRNLPLLLSNTAAQKTSLVRDNHNNMSPLNNTNLPSIDNTRNPQSVFIKNLNSDILIDKKHNPVLFKMPKTIDTNWNSRITSNDRRSPVIINNTQNIPTLTDNNKNSPLFDDKRLFTYIYNNKNSAPAASSKMNSPTITKNNKYQHTFINHPLYENTRKAINKKIVRNRANNVITRPMLETNVISVPILETRKSANAPGNVPFVSIDNVKNSLPIPGKAHSTLKINRNTNLKKLKSTSGTLLDPYEKKNTYSVKMLPVKTLKMPKKRAQANRLSMGNRRMAVMTMNTEDFFSQRRFVTAKPPPLVVKPQQSRPSYSLLRPKFANIDRASRRFENRRQPVYLKPKEYVVEPIGNNVKYYKKVPVRRKAQQEVNNNMATVRRPTMRPNFVKNRVISKKSLIPANYQRMTRRPVYNEVIRVPVGPDSSDNYSPAPFYHRRRGDSNQVTTEAARTPRRRRTIFFLSPTVPYNQYD